MSTTDEIVAVRTEVKGAREGAAELDEVAGAADRVGKEADQAGKKTGRASRRLSLFGRSASRAHGPLRSMTRSLIGFTGAFAAIAGLRASVDTTEELGKSAMGLARNLGLSDKEAVRWAGTARLRGIDAAALAKSGAFLGKQMLAAARGSKTARAAFDAFGVSQETIKKGDFTQVLMEMADGYQRMPAGVRRTALAQQLMSRGAAALTPLLASGSKGLAEQLGLMDKYGVTALAAGQGGIKKFLAAQRESKAATLGFQVAIGTTLIPALTKLLGLLPWLNEGLRHGGGAFAVLRWAIKGVVGVGKGVTGFFDRNESAAKILTGTVLGLVAAYLLTKGTLLVTNGVMKAHTLWTGATTLATSEMTAGQWLLNAALSANPIVLVVGALILLGGAFFIAYRKSATFRAGVHAVWGKMQAVFGWIRGHWPLLTMIIFGPLGAAIVLIVRHWRPLAGFFSGAWHKIVAAFEWAWRKIRPIVDAISSFMSGASDFFGGTGPISAANQRGLTRALTGQAAAPPGTPHNARGGRILRGGMAWVGERGAELLSLPAGASIWPRARAALAAPLPGPAGGYDRDLVVHTHLILDGREIAVSVDRHVGARKALR